ncbi:MAG: SBBP repeat-containing protein [Candidatus Aminicenantes bacterium]|nr:SBBP repeat-containing protein [Candidatus Aminicenantes bacterium]
MNKCGLMVVILIISLFTGPTYDSRAQQGNGLPQAAQIAAGQAKVKMDKDYGKMPLSFIPNKGQMDRQVYFYMQGKDKSVYFTSTGLTYSLSSPRWVVKLDFVGARKDVKPELLEKSGTVVSYFKGKEKDWQTGLQAASKIIYRELWPGIDLLYYGTVNKMKYEFIVRPGANPAKIKLTYRGADSVKENSQGQLEVQTKSGGFVDDTPVAWQDISGKRESVSLKYAVESGKEKQNTPDVTYGFSVGEYNKNEALILDPAVIVYCGYIGGSVSAQGDGIAVDTSGCAYVTGATDSTETDFPVTVGPELTFNGAKDAFVAKVRADGTGLVYCGYIGGSGNDYGQGIAVDASGCAYITGNTDSTETTFPVIGGPDLTQNGGQDAFVAKVNADGTGLEYCGYIGGSGSENSGYGIAVDGSGCAYITGNTASTETTFPVISGPDLTQNGGQDAFVAKVKADGTGLDYCGYVGGSFDEECFGIALDASDCSYITGYTKSTETTFPVAVGPDLTHNGGNEDAFVAKIKTDGTGLVYCGYIGGSDGDAGYAIAVDTLGCAYITGATESSQTGFPVMAGPGLTYNGERDAFVAKIKADGTALDYCGYISGSGWEESWAIVIDATGCIYVTGHTSSTETTFPVIGGPDLTYNGGTFDAFVAKVNTAGTTLDYCGYIGGSSFERGHGIAVDAVGCVYVTGSTYSTETTFPITVGPDLTFNGGNYEAFVAKISWTNPIYAVNFAVGNGGALTGVTTQTVLEGSNCTAVEAVPNSGYEFVNWTGTGGFVTTTDNPLTVTNVTADMTITAHFLFSNPAGWTPSESLQYNMIVYGKAYNGNNPAAAGDWIAAFGPDGAADCRGASAVQTDGNYILTIGSNVTFGEAISFKLWPLPSGPSLDGSETVDFIDNNVYNGLSLHFGPRGQNIALVNGWNWISFNVLPGDTSLNSVFAGLAGAIEQVKSQSQAAIYSGGSWIGDLADMSGVANGIMYKVKTNQDCVVTVSGSTIPFNQPLPLITGWNWTAYLPTLNQPVEDAVNSIITPVSQVKSQYKSVIKIGSTLYGDLTDMEPNKGYTILMTAPGTLVYPYAVAVFPDQRIKKRAAINTQDTPLVSWPVIKGNQYNMVTLGKVFFEGKAISGPGYYLVGQGSKGEKDNRSFSPIGNDGSYFSTILGNAGGEAIKFKLYNSASGKTYDVVGSLAFQPDDLKTAYDVKARSVKVTAPVAGTTMRAGDGCNISWDAYEVNNVKIELYKGGRSLSVIASSVPAGACSYNWTIPGRMPFGEDFKIKVTCTDAGVIAGDSSKTFSIKPAPSIVLISPNGGEVWHVKQGVDIKWRSGGIDNVKIELYKGTELKTVIAAKVPAGTGKYTWSIPANHSQGTKFKIKISSVDAGVNLIDVSDSWFSIRQ